MAKPDAKLIESNLETIATCALCVASADGNIDPREKVALSERLAAYAAPGGKGVAKTAVSEAMERAAEALLRDGTSATLRRIGTLALAPELKSVLLEASVFVAGADGKVADGEVRMLNRIATTIGLAPAEVERALATLEN